MVKTDWDFNQCRMKYEMTLKFGIHFSLLHKTQKLIIWPFNIEMVFFKLVFFLNIANYITACLILLTVGILFTVIVEMLNVPQHLMC